MTLQRMTTTTTNPNPNPSPNPYPNPTPNPNPNLNPNPNPNLNESPLPQPPKKFTQKIKAPRPKLGASVGSIHSLPHKYTSSPSTKRSGGSSPSKNLFRPQGEMLTKTTIGNPSRLKILGGTRRNLPLRSPSVYLRPMMGKVKEALFSTLVSIGVYSGTTPVNHLDVFAGSGSVGLESLSRMELLDDLKTPNGGSTFVDFSDDCCNIIKVNLDSLDFPPPLTAGEASSPNIRNTNYNQIVCADYKKALEDPISVGIFSKVSQIARTKHLIPLIYSNYYFTQFDVITITPPYEEVVYEELMQSVGNSPLLKDNTVVVVEYPVELGSLPHGIEGTKLVGVRNRRYGRTVLAFYVNAAGGVGIDRVLEGAVSRPDEFLGLSKKGKLKN